MNTTQDLATTTETFHAVPVWEAATHLAKAEKLQKRIDDKGLSGSVSIEISNRRDEKHFDEFLGQRTIEVCDVEFTFEADISLGEFTAVAVADWTGADEELVFSFNDDVAVTGTWDRTRCDHCERRVERNKVIVVADTDGNQIHLGGTCAKDFLGHNVFQILSLREGIERNEFPEDPRLPLAAFIRAAAEATNVWGFEPVSSNRPTKIVAQILVRGGKGLDADEVRELGESNAVSPGTAEEMIEWAAAETGSEFAINISKVARSEWIGPKAFGIAAFIPEGFARAKGALAERAAVKAAEEALKADAEDVPEGKGQRIAGTVVSVKTREDQWGTTRKMVVVDDRGFKVWGTVPKALDFISNFNEETSEWADIPCVAEGDRVAFNCSLVPSDDDTKFGFFKRPTKAVREGVTASS